MDFTPLSLLVEMINFLVFLIKKVTFYRIYTLTLVPIQVSPPYTILITPLTLNVSKLLQRFNISALERFKNLACASIAVCVCRNKTKRLGISLLNSRSVDVPLSCDF